MKQTLKTMLTVITFTLSSPALMADEERGSSSATPPAGNTYNWGPGMMYGPGYGPGYGMGPGMMHGPGYGPGYGMGPGMMYGPGYGSRPDSDDDDAPTFWGPGMMHRPGYGGRR